MTDKKPNATQFSQIASLIGEPARAVMLWKMLEGKAFTATELAIGADVSPQSTSMHLAKLIKAKLVTVISQGRYKYYRLASPEVAYVLESISNLVPADKAREEPLHVNQHDLRYCRSCYDHLAGKVGVAITDQLLKQKIMTDSDSHYELTTKGEKWLMALNISADDLKKQRRAFARKCLDWSERRYHVSGSLGSALLDSMIEKKWLRRVKDSRVVLLTQAGQEQLYELFRLNL